MQNNRQLKDKHVLLILADEPIHCLGHDERSLIWKFRKISYV